MMKKIVTGLVIAINFAFSSYGADSQDDGLWLRQAFDSLLSWDSSPDNPLVPLPHLPTREEMAAHQPTTTLLSSSSTSHFEYPAGESPLEQLPLELFEHMWQLIPSQYRGHLALASQDLAIKSQYSRVHSQAATTHLTIPVRDITSKNLKDAEIKFPKVTSLTITRAPKEAAIIPEQLTLLATRFPNIISLNLSNTDLTEAGMTTLVQVFKHLISLNLSRNPQIGDVSIAQLIEAPFIHTLESLDVSHTNITVDGVTSLATPGRLIALKTLNLDACEIGDEGIAALIEAPFACVLESLNIACARITSDGVALLATPGRLIALKELGLGGNDNIGFRGDEGISELINAPFARILESLDLKDTGLTDIGVELLALSNVFISLKTFDLSWNRKIHDASVEMLLTAPFASKLEVLEAGTKVTTRLKRKFLLFK